MIVLLLVAAILNVVTNGLALLCAWLMYWKCPTHPLLGVFIGVDLNVLASSSMFHACVAVGIEYCPQSLQAQLSQDTIWTYLSVVCTFAAFYPRSQRFMTWYMGSMFVFVYLLHEVLFDSFWTVLLIVPVSGSPFVYFGQTKEVVRQIRKHSWYYCSCALGLTAVYFKFAAGSEPNTDTYNLNHPFWHFFVFASKASFILDQPSDENEQQAKLLPISHIYDPLELTPASSPPSPSSSTLHSFPSDVIHPAHAKWTATPGIRA